MKKNYWAMSIFIFLALCVCGIIFSVFLALSHPVQEDRTYFSTKQNIDSQINEILKTQQEFAKQCQLYVNLNALPQIQKQFQIFNPYVAPRLTEVPQFSLGNQKIYLVAQCKEPRVLKIKSFLERINAEETQELGILQAMQEKLFESQEFSPSHAGRYKIIFEVLDEAKQSTLFFQKEVFFQ